ncbi:MAG: hypothetical protein ACO3C1_13275, partial [Ilumatobacteraceae bacterium]
MTWLSPPTALWATRVLWVASAVSTAIALDGAEHLAGSGTLAVAWWAIVGAVLVALVVPGCLALTAIRAVAPALLPSVAALLVSTSSSEDASTGTSLAACAAVVCLAAACAVALSAEFGEAMVQASAYGHERRLPLRVPAAATIAIGATWCLWALLVTATSLVVAADQRLAGAAVAVVALAAGAVLWRTYHRFALRWLVLVPAGLVVHDPVVLGETLMVLRPNVVGARLAPSDTGAADLTGPAPGFAVEVSVRDAAPVLFAAARAHPPGRGLPATAVLG